MTEVTKMKAFIYMLIACSMLTFSGIDFCFCFCMKTYAQAAGFGTEEIKRTVSEENPVYEQTVWDSSHEVKCKENLAACCLLQVIMMGEFEDFDSEDILYLRIFSAVFSQLRQISENDFLHMETEFGCEDKIIREKYEQALKNCLYADILFREQSGTVLTDPEMVWLLFLSFADDKDGMETAGQIREIRDNMTEEVIEILAESAGVTVSFTKKIIYGSEASSEKSP